MMEEFRVYLFRDYGRKKLWIALKAVLRRSYIRWRVSRTVRDVNEKCPACGHRKGNIKFSEVHKQLLHSCEVCQAAWGEPCIVKPDAWKVVMPTGDEPEQLPNEESLNA